MKTWNSIDKSKWTNLLNLATNSLTGLVVGVYLLFSLITLSGQYIRAPRAESGSSPGRLRELQT